MSVLAPVFDAVRRVQPALVRGSVASIRGLTVMVDQLPLPMGSLVRFVARDAWSEQGAALGEVIGFNRDQAIVMPLGQTVGVRAGDTVELVEVSQTAPVGDALLGRVVDGVGRPIDGLGPVRSPRRLPVNPEPIRAMARARVQEPLRTGVRAIDLMTPLGRGQRMGIFAGPGVGKSTLLGTIARRTSADVNVIGLIGERGREVKDFIEESLGAEGRQKSVVVVATGDESPLMRVRAAKMACTAAEYFRGCGLDVLLMMDSVTRFAHAQRQIGLSVSEPPATKGYTPSVFAQLALLLERAGGLQTAAGATGRGGSITGLYTILVEGDDMTEPIADAARGILDGHIILSRKLAQKAHFPAIDVLDSVSRVADEVSDAQHTAARQQLLRLMAVYREVEDLVQIGAYARGSNPEADVAIELVGAINAILRQGKKDAGAFEEARAHMVKLAAQAADVIEKQRRAKAR
jgi:flagellum-specific ATP synthase